MLEIRKQRGPQRSIHERQRRRRTMRRVVLSVVILVVLLVASAVIYVWYVGQHPSEKALQTVDTRSAAPTIKTPTVDPNAPVGIAQESFSGTAAPGSNASITVKTNPGAACQITVKVNNNNATLLPDTGLVPKIADEFGIIDWSWTVPKNILPGILPVEITCANAAKKSAYYKANLEVTK